MLTTLPRIHVAVMGIEKVIPSLTDLPVFLLLARSATGQKLSFYTTLVPGPRQAGELDGPEEFHLILMDNGRARQIAGPFREACSASAAARASTSARSTARSAATRTAAPIRGRSAAS